jgi:hypothetical protein
MKKTLLLFISIFFAQFTFGQALTVEKIMQDQSKWIGTSPSNIFWSEDGKTLYFSWNPDNNNGDSLYKFVLPDRIPLKVTPKERRALPAQLGTYSPSRSMKVYEKQGELYLLYTKTLKIKQLTNTIERESNPYFSGDETKIIFGRSNNLFSFSLEDGSVTQLSNFLTGSKKAEAKPANDEEKWLKADQLAMFEVLKERKEKKLTAKDLLHKESKDDWFDMPYDKKQMMRIENENLLAGSSTQSRIGIDTQGQTLRNASHDLRACPPNPKFNIGPWMNSTIEPDYNIKPIM